jgi:hypothetical protein
VKRFNSGVKRLIVLLAQARGDGEAGLKNYELFCLGATRCITNEFDKKKKKRKKIELKQGQRDLGCDLHF